MRARFRRKFSLTYKTRFIKKPKTKQHWDFIKCALSTLVNGNLPSSIDEAAHPLSFTGISSVAMPDGVVTTMANPPAHHDLFSVLTELYTLLDDLAVVLPSVAILPPPQTGVHLPSDFDANAAKAAGFSDEAVEVLSSMPFLDYPLELQPSSMAVPYWGMDQSTFEDTRELIPGDLDEGLAPPSIIKLTDSSASMGVQYMYDADTSTFIPLAS